MPNSGEGSQEETWELLKRAKARGMKVKDVAVLLGVTPQQVSTYRHTPMPLNSRRVLRAHLDSLENPHSEVPNFPWQRTAKAHQNLDWLARATGAEGPLWDMVAQTLNSLLRMVERKNDRQMGEGSENGRPE